MTGVVTVKLWGTVIGYLGYEPGQNETATFEYDREFADSGIQLSPVVMPSPPRIHRFPEISRPTFKGLPGIFADSLPDTFGERLIDLYMAEKKIPAQQVTALDRLLYTGSRGMGALEYEPAAGFIAEEHPSLALDVHRLAELAALVTEKNAKRNAELLSEKNIAAAIKLIRVGSSAGGARAKALVARIAAGTFVDGTAEQTEYVTHWLLKFDSDENADRDGKDPKGITRVEYVYSLIARECGIEIPETDFIEEGKDFHYLIRRFDRETAPDGRTRKIHYASWAALAHADRDSTGTHSYEELILLARNLDLGQDSVTRLFTRAVFNIAGRNQDDHTKNFGFLMNREGEWRLSPAFDLTWSYEPQGRWTRTHQIRLNRKQDGFTREDLLAFGRYCNLDGKKAGKIIDSVCAAFSAFPALAREYGVPKALAERVADTQRLSFPNSTA